MNRTLRTLLLSATALGALATAATAAPPPTPGATAGMASMHATATAQTMHGGGMSAMHATMTADPAGHQAMLDDPAMQAHMAEYGLEADQMRRWHDTGISVDQMHAELEEQGIDVDAMQADCPMSTHSSMATMHRDGGHDMSDHHGFAGGDRS